MKVLKISGNFLDYGLIAVSAIGIMVCLFLLNQSEEFQSAINVQDNQEIGKITFNQNDIRQKHSNNLFWNKVNKSNTVYLGDSIYTGQFSQSEITLSDQNKIQMKENSLVTFNEKNNIKVPNLADGSFLLNVKGNMKVEINGKLTELNAENARVEIKLTGSKTAKIKVIEGKVTLRQPSLKNEIVLNQFTSNSEVELNVESKAVESVVHNNKQTALSAETPRPSKLISLAQDGKTYFYNRKVYDRYSLVENKLKLREFSRSVVEWKTQIENPQFENQSSDVYNSVQFQLTSSSNFDVVTQVIKSQTQAKHVEFTKAHIGENYYRYSVNGFDWSESQKFRVSAQYLDRRVKPPTLNGKKFIVGNSWPVLKIKNKPVQGIPNFIVEVSIDENFGASKTAVLWAGNDELSFPTSQLGKYFIRSFGVDANQQLTEPSDVVELNVDRKAEIPPMLAKNDPERKTASVPPADSVPPTPLLSRSEEKNLKSGQTSMQLKLLDPAYLNQKYANSKLSFEGAGFTMYSERLIDQEKSPPVALTMALRILDWRGDSGYEGVVRTKLASLSDSSADNPSPTSLELRYHRRYATSWSPFSNYGESKLSWIMGFEYYRNSGTTAFSPKYDLFKLGLGFNFPFMKSMATGGELVLGLGLDNSKKYEISGFVDYFMKDSWSLGVGYKVHLFESGSESSSPGGVYPYREGFGEGYSALKWSY